MSKHFKYEDVYALVTSIIVFNYDRETIKEEFAKMPTIEVSEDAISRRGIKIRLGKRFSDDPRRIMEIVKETVDDAPSVIPQPKEGEWLLDGRCSNCLQAPLTTHKTYCPNCGAKMKGASR